MRGLVIEVSTQAGAWCSEVPLRFPEMRITVDSHFPLDGDRSIESVRLEGAGARLAVELMRANPRVERLEEAEVGEREAAVRIVIRGCYLPKAVQHSLVTPSMPYELREGGHRWMLVGPEASLKSFVFVLEKMGARVEVLHGGELRPEGLTPRQRSLLDLAVRRGYYDFPRRVTQADLAKELGVSRAAVSEMMMVVESKVIASTLAVAPGAAIPRS